jgi:SAM-dependent methyltransferase
LLPAGFALFARRSFLGVRGRLYRGAAVSCACCGGHFSRFLEVGTPPRAGACPRCDSRERHRLLHLYLSRKTNLFKEKLRVLHVAPEAALQAHLAGNPNIDYLSADASSSSAMVRMDITAIQFPDASFDVILCNHVLEHVDDDRRAMRELLRVLKPGGWAILQVPIDVSRDRTLEDPGVTDPRERERLFGQWDHVRFYGRDYADRLREAGFELSVERFAHELPADVVGAYGIDLSEDIYLCRRPAGRG